MKKLLSSVLTLLLLGAVGSEVQSQRAKSADTFAAFWAQFKAAVARNDKEAVASLTRFPFYLDKELTRAEFIKKYGQIFNRKIQRCIAKEKPVNDYQSSLAAINLAKKHGQPVPQRQPDTGSYSLYCGEELYAFERAGGKYKFTGLGAND